MMPRDIVASREQAIERALEAGNRILADTMTPAERRAWAERFVDKALKSGLIAIAVSK